MRYAARLARAPNGWSLSFPDLPDLSCQVESRESAGDEARGPLNAHLFELLTSGQLPSRPRARAGPSWILVPVYGQNALALQVRWARQEQGLTLEQVARRMGVTRQRIAALEVPTANWTMATLRRLSDALELDLDIALRPRRVLADHNGVIWSGSERRSAPEFRPFRDGQGGIRTRE